MTQENREQFEKWFYQYCLDATTCTFIGEQKHMFAAWQAALSHEGAGEAVAWRIKMETEPSGYASTTRADERELWEHEGYAPEPLYAAPPPSDLVGALEEARDYVADYSKVNRGQTAIKLCERIDALLKRHKGE